MIPLKLREKMEHIGINQQGRDGIIRIDNVLSSGRNLNYRDSKLAHETIMYLVETLVMPETLSDNPLSKLVERARKEGFAQGKIAGYKKGKAAPKEKTCKKKAANRKKDEATIGEPPKDNPSKNDAADSRPQNPPGTDSQD